jgi:hypothetical protein
MRERSSKAQAGAGAGSGSQVMQRVALVWMGSAMLACAAPLVAAQDDVRHDRRDIRHARKGHKREHFTVIER